MAFSVSKSQRIVSLGNKKIKAWLSLIILSLIMQPAPCQQEAPWKIVFKHLPSTLQTLFLSTKKEKKHLLPSILSKDRSSWKTWPNLSWNLKRYRKNIIHYAHVMEVRTPSLVSGLTCLSLTCTEIHFNFEIFMKSIVCKGKSNLA